jgi:hypothetical protein
MVSTEVPELAPGVMVGGANVAVAPAGNPVSDIVTTLLYAPLIDVAEMLYVALPPGSIVWVPDGMLSVKSGRTSG